jgi:hypothetical protein
MPPFVVALILMAISTLLTMLLVKPNKVKPASLQDFDLPVWEDGTPQSVLFGDGWVSGSMIVWYGNLRTKKIKAKGGKK